MPDSNSVDPDPSADRDAGDRDEADRAAGAPPYPESRYAWYVVAVLMLAYVSSFVDRQILSLLVAPMKRDLGINDTQVSLLMGFSFALFYTVMGLPLGRLADRKSRRAVIGVGVTVWSAMTAACGVVNNFWQFFAARVGVGVGEASLGPAAYSMITDYFPEGRRATALSVYSMGIYIGSGMAYLLGGLVIAASADGGTTTLPLVGEVFDWQLIFFYVGLPGVLIALLMLTVTEPVRRGVKTVRDRAGAETYEVVPIRAVLGYMWRNRRTFGFFTVGIGLWAMLPYGGAAWTPEFFRRTYGLSIVNAGLLQGTVTIVFATAGVVWGGWYADRLKKRGYADANARLVCIVALAMLPTGLFFPLMPNATLATLLLIPNTFLACAPFGASAAAIQELTPNRMRGVASALYLFVLNLIGLGLGPTVVAVLTDYVFGRPELLRYSLFSMSLVAGAAAALCVYLGLGPYRETIKRLREEREAAPASP